MYLLNFVHFVKCGYLTNYICGSSEMYIFQVLPKLSAQTLHALVTSDELWVPNEEKRYKQAQSPPATTLNY